MIRVNRHFLCFLLCLLTVLPSLRAEVYSLWPFSRGTASSTPFFRSDDNPADLPERKFWREKILVNGTEMELDVSLIDLPLQDAAALLRKRAPHARYASSSDSFMIYLPLADGSVRKLWLVSLRGVNPVLQFSLVLPASRSEAPDSAWPDTIPLLPGAAARSVMHFTARKADFASFQVSGMTRAQVLHEMSTRLTGTGWLPASEEISNPFRASGEVFFREKPLRLLLLGASESGDGKVMVTVYTRPMEKTK